jgi:hypothetical protein
MKINDTAEKSNRFNAKGIVHGRLLNPHHKAPKRYRTNRALD